MRSDGSGETSSASRAALAGRVLYWLVGLALAVPAVLVTAARVSGSERGPALKLVALTPLGLPLWTALVVLLLLGSLLRPAGSRSRRLGATLVALVGLGLHVAWFSPQVLGSPPHAAPGARTLTVMNANLYVGQADAAAVVAAVTEHHVDVLVAEEITPAEVDRLHAAGLGAVLPQEAGRADPQVSGTMVFADQAISDVVDLHTFFQSYQMTVGGLTLIAAHPLSPEFPSGWRHDHDLVRQAAVASGADLVVGDLNATPDHTVMRRLGDAGFRDVGEEAIEGWQPTWPSNHLGVPGYVPPLVAIDHVLVGPALAGLGAETVRIDATDHRALIARVALR